eukprot:1195723-Prorocentrum_minimum.AAC.1
MARNHERSVSSSVSATVHQSEARTPAAGATPAEGCEGRGGLPLLPNAPASGRWPARCGRCTPGGPRRRQGGPPGQGSPRAAGRSWPGGPRPTPTTPDMRQGKRARRARDPPHRSGCGIQRRTEPVGTAAHPGGCAAGPARHARHAPPPHLPRPRGPHHAGGETHGRWHSTATRGTAPEGRGGGLARGLSGPAAAPSAGSPRACGRWSRWGCRGSRCRQCARSRPA